MACSIELEDKVILTGGYTYQSTVSFIFNLIPPSSNSYLQANSTVSVYNFNGWQEDLPSLNQGRYNHGCGHYISQDNSIVKFIHSH